MAQITSQIIHHQFQEYQQDNFIRIIHLIHILDNLKIAYTQQQVQNIQSVKNDSITFDELLAIVTDLILNLEFRTDEESENSLYDRKIHMYIRLLGEYISICEKNLDYINMQKTKLKIEEIRKHERKRFKKLLNKYQSDEVKQLKQQKKSTHEEFDMQWKNYFS